MSDTFQQIRTTIEELYSMDEEKVILLTNIRRDRGLYAHIL